MATASRLCLICGQVLSGDQERLEHLAAEHPGQRVAWHDKLPYIVGPDGTETKIRPSALKRMRLAARRAQGLPPAPGRAVKRPVSTSKGPAHGSSSAAPPPSPEPAIQVPLDDPLAPPYFRQAPPPHFAFGDPAPTAADGTPVPGASRAALKLELGQPVLAEMIRNLSMVVSDWDGAGPSGVFSHTEAAQLAMLVHEPTLDLVERYFAGNVNRFRLGMAAIIIFLGKGRIHYQAIRRRQLEAVTSSEPIEDFTAAARAATQPVPVMAREVPSAAPLTGTWDELDNPIAALAARQAAARGQQAPSEPWRADFTPEELAAWQAHQAAPPDG